MHEQKYAQTIIQSKRQKMCCVHGLWELGMTNDDRWTKHDINNPLSGAVWKNKTPYNI
jgi:hypothetical protein